MGLERLTPAGLFKPAAYTQVVARGKTALTGAGATPADVTKITIYIVGYKPELRPLLGEARSAVFGSTTLPASTLGGVQALAEPGFFIEVEAIAELDEA
jgi:enamine deaminase RidA (YjgF/YER057c/UK114 family)